MEDAQRPVSPTSTLDKLLAPARFSYISAGACTPDEVEKQTKVSRSSPSPMGPCWRPP